ncbi:MAG: hypothetical protein ABSH28_10385 [Acidobacteriota bacterium]
MMNAKKKWCGRWVQVLVIGMLLAVAMSPEKGQAQAQAQAATAKRAFETRDWYRVKTVASPAMSPDGKYVAVQVTSVLEAANKRVNEIWVVSTAPGGDPVRFTAPGVDSTNPRFNADGTLLIFNSTRPGYPGNQWAIRMDRPGGEFPYTTASAGPGSEAADSGEFSGRQGGAFPGGGGFPGGGPASSSPKDGSFIVTTGTEGAPAAAGGGAGQGRGGGRGTGQGGGPDEARGAVPADPNDPYAKMPPMAKPPATAITLPLDPARFDGNPEHGRGRGRSSRRWRNPRGRRRRTRHGRRWQQQPAAGADSRG